MDFPSVVYVAFAVSFALSAILSWIILPPTRSVLRRVCPAEDAVAFWSRFTLLMLFLGPLIVTLIFGVPYSALYFKLTPADQVLRVVSAALVGAFLTLGGIGLRIGTIRKNVVVAPAHKRTDDEYIK